MPADAETAMTGAWRKGPGRELFDALAKVRLDTLRLQVLATSGSV